MAPVNSQVVAVRVEPDKEPRLSKETVTIPEPEGRQIRVRVLYVAQNPADTYKVQASSARDGVVPGCDVVGVVEQTGPNATRFKKGATVAGLIWGGNVEGIGGFSEYTLADERFCFEVPEGTPLAEASTIPLTAGTSELALFSKRCLDIEKDPQKRPQPNTPVLIWGGASGVGVHAIQLAVLHGLEVTTTCSPQHFDYVRSLGASHVFDYRDRDVVDKVRKAAPDLRYAFDTIGKGATSEAASQAMVPGAGSLCTVQPGLSGTENVVEGTEVSAVFLWTCWLVPFDLFDKHWPASQQDHDMTVAFLGDCPRLLTQGKLKGHKPKVFENGLDGVPDGFKEHSEGKISGYKIVYQIGKA